MLLIFNQSIFSQRSARIHRAPKFRKLHCSVQRVSILATSSYDTRWKDIIVILELPAKITSSFSQPWCWTCLCLQSMERYYVVQLYSLLSEKVCLITHIPEPELKSDSAHYSPTTMVDQLVEYSISSCTFTTTQLKFLLTAPNKSKLSTWHNLRSVVAGGEMIPPWVVREFYNLKLPDASLFNGYARSETTLCKSLRT